MNSRKHKEAQEDLIPAVAYLRMSDEVQSLSPEQQKREVAEYAKRNGYKILRWYKDEGKSASRGTEGDEERVDFQQLLIDSNQREFRAVLCWSTSRFTRNHPHEAGLAKRILRNNGVWLDTVKEGKIDWNTFEGMIKDSIFNLLDHKYSVDLGRDSLRGRRNTFLNGGYPYGSIPYGYCPVYFNGSERKTVSRKEQRKNLRGWMQTLAVVEEEAEIVRQIFDWYVNHDMSINAIAHKLNGMGIPGPGTGANAVWDCNNVRRRLRCRTYVRLSRIGDPVNKKRHRHNAIEPEERLGDWQAIVDRDVWDRAQEKFNGNKGHAHEGRSGCLQGILKCGVCGYVLRKENKRRADDPRGDKYRCGTTANGRPSKCHRWTCYESEVLPILCQELVAAVDEEALRLLGAQPDKPGKISNREVLEAHLKALAERLSEATDQLLDPKKPASVKKAIEAKIEELDLEATETRQRLQALAVADDLGGVERFAQWWESVRGELVDLSKGKRVDPPQAMARNREHAEELVKNGWPVVSYPDGEDIGTVSGLRAVDPGKLRALLKRLKVSVKVYWRPFDRTGKKFKQGRVPEWEVDLARLEVDIPICGFSERRNVWGGCRGFSGRASSRRRASPAPSGNP